MWPGYHKPTPKPDLRTAAARYAFRIPKHRSKLSHSAYWLLHNCVAHPILGLIPDDKTIAFHELTSRWLNTPSAEGFPTLSHPPLTIPNGKRRAWVFHNVVAHMAIGLLPCKRTFDLHDKSAKDLGIKGWV